MLFCDIQQIWAPGASLLLHLDLAALRLWTILFAPKIIYVVEIVILKNVNMEVEENLYLL